MGFSGQLSANSMNRTPTKIIVIGTYFGKWPIWFPAFLLSCARNELIEWLFFTDCEIPRVNYPNIRFEALSLNELNHLASQKLGTHVEKSAYSQVDLQPAFGVIFSEFIEDFEFWGHCDFDVVWGNVRGFITESLLQENDIISCRKEFLAGHLTLWKNKPEVNTLFQVVSAYAEVFSSPECFSFDEAVISTFLKSLITTANNRIRVHWPEQLIVWFVGDASPTGWYWEDGKIYDTNQREYVYLHFQAAKRFITSIDFSVGEQPRKFRFTQQGIRAHQSPILEIWREKYNHDWSQELPGLLLRRFSNALRLLKILLYVKDIYWSRQLAENKISAKDAHYDPRAGRLFLNRINLHIDRRQHFMLAGYNAALLLVNQWNSKFYRDEEGDLFVAIGDVRARVQNVEDLHVLQELFITGAYNMQFSRPTALLDVGMHVGLTSLFFARQPQVVVVGCEPCKLTFDQALENIALNPMLSDRIQTIKVGIGAATYQTIAGYLPRAANHQMSPTTNQNNYGMGPKFEYEETEIKDIACIIDNIAMEYPGWDLALKIDLERTEYYIDGITEYLIVQRLHVTGKIDGLSTIMIKWQRRKLAGPIVIVNQLQEAGFRVLLLEPNNKHEGMLYAIRSDLLKSHRTTL
jgi:FkbM family methyltransferase